MSKRRCIPTNLFFQPRFVALSNDTARLVLIGLITDADDYGRGLAESHLLGRKLDHAPEVIAMALQELEAAHFVQCYGSAEEHYYALCAWAEWQTLSKPTPSRYPAPPVVTETVALPSPGEIQTFQGNPEKPREGLREEEEELNRTEEEGEGEETPEEDVHPHNVVTFPTAIAAVSEPSENTHETTRVVARILKLKETEALERIVSEYGASPHLSLLGEADAAREWIENRGRNRTGQRMTPGFFRRWLKREMEAVQRREAEHERQRSLPGTGTNGTAVASARGMTADVRERPALPNLMQLETQYRQAVQGGKR